MVRLSSNQQGSEIDPAQSVEYQKWLWPTTGNWHYISTVISRADNTGTVISMADKIDTVISRAHSIDTVISRADNRQCYF